MKKRILSLLLCLVMVVGLLPVTAQADMNMADYHGKRITKIVLEASIDSTKIPDYLSSITADSNAYDASKKIVEVGKKLGNGEHMIRFNPISYTYTNGTATTTFDNSGATELLKVEISGIRWQKSDGKWDWASDQMTHYLDGQYRYQFNVSVVESKEDNANEYRIVPNVKVTVNWENSSVQETLTVDPKRVYNHDESFHSYATFTTAPFAATVDTGLKLVAAGSIPSGYANEAIKSFSVASWASGGTKPYTFSKVSGPDGIEVNSDGTVSGAPTAACETEQELTIKVTDSTGTERTATIKVAPVKTARTVIESIELAGLDVPRAGDVIPRTPNVYISKITDADGHVISKDDCPLYLTISREWKDGTGNAIYTNENYTTDQHFDASKTYKFTVQVRLEGKEKCAEYYLPETFTATVSGWEDSIDNTLTVSDTSYMSEENYISLFVESGELKPDTATDSLTGTVSYSGAARYNRTLTANVADLPTGVNESDLSYQWQYKGTNGIWYDINNDNGRSRSIFLNDALDVSGLVGRQLRVTVRCTGKNYTGTLYGDAVTVQKAAAGVPAEPPALNSSANTGGNTANITITNYNDGLEYVHTTTAPSGGSWPTDGTPITGNTFQVMLTGTVQTIYVYARYKETETTEAGISFRIGTALVPKADGSGVDKTARDMIYTENGGRTLTVYVKKGTSITVPYQLSPNDAEGNTLPRWETTYTATDSSTNPASVTVENNTMDKTLKITAGANTGTVYVVAYKQGEDNTPWHPGTDTDNMGRQITVIVYDPDKPASIPFAVTNLGTVNLTVGETYEINKEALRELNFLPAGVDKTGFTLAAAITNYGTMGITFSNSNDYIEVSGDTNQFSVKGKDDSGTTTCEVAFFALPNEVTEISNDYKIASLNVKVGPAVPAAPINSAAVQVDEPMVAAAVGNAVPAETEPNYTIDWTEWVDGEGKKSTFFALDKTYTVKMKLTAKAGYTFANGATFTVNGKSATVPADFTGGNSVIVTYTFARPVHIHAPLGIWYWDTANHWQICYDCSAVIQNTKGAHTITWVIDKVATETENGSKHKECMCGYKTGETQVIPATGTSGTPTDPTPDNPNNPDSPSTPNRPNLPNNPDSSSGIHHSGAGRPYRPDLSTAVPGGTTTAAVQSPKTGDAGIMLYAALSLMSMTGGAWLVSKKRREK